MIAAAGRAGCVALALAWAGPAAAAVTGPVPKDMCETPGACGTIRGFARAGGSRAAMADVSVIAVPASYLPGVV